MSGGGIGQGISVHVRARCCWTLIASHVGLHVASGDSKKLASYDGRLCSAVCVAHFCMKPRGPSRRASRIHARMGPWSG